MRRILPYTTLLMVLAALWTGWVLYSRQQAAAKSEREARQKQIDADQKVVAAFGGDRLTILGFSAARGEVSPGERVVLCYGVANAAQVKIEPAVEPIKPAVSHCLNVFPKKTTTYTLEAEDSQGIRKSASLTVKVR